MSHYESVQHAARILRVTERDLRRAVEHGLVDVWIYGGGPRRRRYLVEMTSASDWKLATSEP